MSKDGYVYRKHPNYVHIEDGKRAEMGVEIAEVIDLRMREAASDFRTRYLCPGCYMVVGVNTLITLASLNKQDMRELARCIIGELQRKLDNDDWHLIEEIKVEKCDA